MEWTFFKELASLHNKVAFNKVTQETFNRFLIDNMDKIDADCIPIVVENTTLEHDYFVENKEVLLPIYQKCIAFFIEGPERDMGLRDMLRVAIFMTICDELNWPKHAG